MLLAIVKFFGVRGTIAAGVALAACMAAAWFWLGASKAEMYKARAEMHEQRAVNLVEQLRVASTGIAQCGAINRNTIEAVAACRKQVQQLKQESQRLDDLAQERGREIIAAQTAIRDADRARRARAVNPPANEMTAVIRDAMLDL